MNLPVSLIVFLKFRTRLNRFDELPGVGQLNRCFGWSLGFRS